ncbi:DNA (cytosine-5)-methyltransferase 3-like [Elgaria multicarinata webbii]|uniref:DNA (cytosine-5)-methyltransferase 3-like n=1 Tax=Elgaria multicarinata webbii TaxID=159646 RepID=UPI002FCCD166
MEDELFIQILECLNLTVDEKKESKHSPSTLRNFGLCATGKKGCVLHSAARQGQGDLQTVVMTQEHPAVIMVDANSDSEEMSSLSEAVISFRDSPDMLSLGSVEEVSPSTMPRSNRAVSLGDSSSDHVISVSSIEEFNTPKSSKEICICCGGLEIHTNHPLFHGGICAPCTEKFLERFFLCDDDGSQADCTICCWGKSLIICDDPKCHRCFCEECVDTLVHPGSSEEIKQTNPWICFMCVPWDINGLLKRKTKWRAELKRFYDQESNADWIYPLLSPWERKPIHVLSLFDDITPELRSFGFLGESMGNGRLKFLDDVTDVIRTHIEDWGPYDFIFGSTPPVAKSYQHPSAWYFYQYFRILQYGRPTERSNKPFFWLFLDNIVLDEEDRDTASRFFQVEAVLKYKQHGDIIKNAVHIWSNIPSVNSKYSASSLYMDSSLLAKTILAKVGGARSDAQASKPGPDLPASVLALAGTRRRRVLSRAPSSRAFGGVFVTVWRRNFFGGRPPPSFLFCKRRPEVSAVGSRREPRGGDSEGKPRCLRAWTEPHGQQPATLLGRRGEPSRRQV